jgi:hypothetical protein
MSPPKSASDATSAFSEDETMEGQYRKTLRLSSDQLVRNLNLIIILTVDLQFSMMHVALSGPELWRQHHIVLRQYQTSREGNLHGSALFIQA